MLYHKSKTYFFGLPGEGADIFYILNLAAPPTVVRLVRQKMREET